MIGADVCKPGLNQLPSLIGVVGSTDGNMAKWRTALRAQPAKTEIITDFGNILVDLYHGCSEVSEQIVTNDRFV